MYEEELGLVVGEDAQVVPLRLRHQKLKKVVLVDVWVS